MKIGAIIEWRWSLEGENKKKESRDDEGGSEDSPRESQEEELYCLSLTRIVFFFSFLQFLFCFL